MIRYLLYFFILLLLSLLSFVFFFPAEPVKFNSVTVPGKFSISVPGYLSGTDSIDPSALLQYKNEKEEMFLILYEKTDSLPLQTLFEKTAADFVSKVGNARLLKYYPLEINSHRAMAGNIRGSVNETGVYYRLAIIEAGNSYYEIIEGIADKNLSGYDEDMNRTIASFTLLP